MIPHSPSRILPTELTLREMRGYLNGSPVWLIVELIQFRLSKAFMIISIEIPMIIKIFPRNKIKKI
tara:strand:+ start:112 stop:309 length:198 start_codon:yes stop_codon:yes gene_type:complete